MNFKSIISMLTAVVLTAVSVHAQSDVLDIVLNKTLKWEVDGTPVELPHSPNTDQAKIGRIAEFVKTNLTYTCDLSSLIGRFGEDHRYFVRFDGCGRVSIVTMNGGVVGVHNGGVTPFTYELTKKINFNDNATNLLSVITSNKDTSNLIPISGDDRGWEPVGIFDDVHLIVAPAHAEFNGYVVKTAKEMPEFGPGLYHYGDSDAGLFCISDPFSNVPFGWYNQAGQKVLLRGVCYQRDGPFGMIIPREAMERDLKLIKLMGANAIRTTHRPMNEFFYDWCDSHGIYVLTEIPVIGSIGNSKHQENAETAMTEMIMNFRHHPCILAWGVGNELHGNYAEITAFVGKMRRRAKELDPTRPIYIAQDSSEAGRTMTDILGLNCYDGWYGGGNGSRVFDICMKRSNSWGRHEFIISEFGFGANAAQFSNELTYIPNPNTRNFHPMDWQTWGHINAYRAIHQNEATNTIGYISYAGCFIYEMFDSLSFRRNEGGIPFTNTKGLITRNRRRAKDAYYFYKANWNPQPMLHVCGRKNDTLETVLNNISNTSVTKNLFVFCNTGRGVECTLDGVHFATKTPDSVKTVKFEIPLTNRVNKITVTDGEFTENVTVTLNDSN